MAGFDLDPGTMMAGLVFGGIGFVAFRYGRQMHRTPPLVLGMALMTYPIFVPSTLWTVLIGTALTAGLWFWRD
jgi:hypothetical protein